MIGIAEQLRPYEPELGQLMYGTPPGEFTFGKLEKWAVTSLRRLATLTKVESLSQNIGGVSFRNDVFEMRNYHWCADDEDCPEAARPNFKCGDVEIRWYKYLGRGMSVNRQITKEELTEIFQKCTDSLPPTA